MTTFKTVQVGSHIAEISFGGAKIPLGFLAAHRKKSHRDCERGGGFVIRSMPGHKGKINVVCECATTRAAQKLKQVGVQGFEILGSDWLAKEKIKIEESEAKCRDEGYHAAPDVACPYPEKTDQALAWQEGRDKKLREEASSPRVEEEHDPKQGDEPPAA